jgi:hypothetical protein
VIILTTTATTQSLARALATGTGMGTAEAGAAMGLVLLVIHATHHYRLRMSERKKKQGRRLYRRYRRHSCSFYSFRDDDDRWRLILKRPWVA